MRTGLYCIIMLAAITASAYAYDWTTNPGDGSPENPYQISEPNHLIDLGQNTTFSRGTNFVLVNDLVFDPDHNPSHQFTEAVIPELRVIIDGQGFSIMNLKIDAPTYNSEPIGLIGILDYGAALKNLNIPNAQISVGNNFQKVGILCGLNGRFIHNCHVYGTIICGTGSTRIGGLCGSNGDGASYYGEITHCQADISISCSSATGVLGECGGLCGFSNGTIAHCSSNGTVNAWSMNLIGGICGYQEWGTVISCSCDIDVTAQRYLGFSGGLCGQNSYGAIRYSQAKGDLISEGSLYYGYETICRVGGFCGYNSAGTIESCYSTGSVICGPVEIGQGEESGGFCGRNAGSEESGIYNCYSTGDVICGSIIESFNRERWIGGFCGTNEAMIKNSYSTGTIYTDAVEKAGFCYVNYDTIEGCFWDTDSSGILTAGYGGALTGVAGKTTAEMQDLNTFLDADWDFVDETANGDDDIWTIEPNQYPSIYRESYSGGDGSPQHPFQIGMADDLISLGMHTENYYDCFVLARDVDLSAHVFEDALIAPDKGITTSQYDGSAFNGHFNGWGHTINSLTIQSNAIGKEYIGLFGAISESAEVKNLALSNVSISGTNMAYIGGICGQNNGVIQRCQVSGSIQGKAVAGGIGGDNNNIIVDCYTSGIISGSGMCGGISGGVGLVRGGSIEKCYSTASIQSGSVYKGGITGYLRFDVQLLNCFWDTTASGVSVGYYYVPSQFWGIIENVEGYTTSQMKERANFIGWDFVGEEVNGSNNIWRMCVDGVDYPRLSWEFAQNGDFACDDGVDLADLEALAECWLLSEPVSPAVFNYSCDGNGDGVVDLADFAVLSTNWE